MGRERGSPELGIFRECFGGSSIIYTRGVGILRALRVPGAAEGMWTSRTGGIRKGRWSGVMSRAEAYSRNPVGVGPWRHSRLWERGARPFAVDWDAGVRSAGVSRLQPDPHQQRRVPSFTPTGLHSKSRRCARGVRELYRFTRLYLQVQFPSPQRIPGLDYPSSGVCPIDLAASSQCHPERGECPGTHATDAGRDGNAHPCPSIPKSLEEIDYALAGQRRRKKRC